MSDEETRSESNKAGGGPQADVALFALVRQLIQGVRLTQDERVVVETSSVASEVHVARREFELGHIEQSLQIVNGVCTAFDQKVSQWENRARQKERHKQQLSGEQIRKMHAEHSGVRTRVRLVKTQLRRLRGGLDQLSKTR